MDTYEQIITRRIEGEARARPLGPIPNVQPGVECHFN